MQETFIIQQVHTFAITVILGIAIGLGYDLLRAVKRFIRFSRAGQFVVDFLFWLTVTALVFLALLASNWGEVRMYVFIGLGTGGAFYAVLFSRLCYQLMVRILEMVASVWRFVTRPVRLFVQMLARISKKVKQVVIGSSKAGRQKMEKIKVKVSRKKKE